MKSEALLRVTTDRGAARVNPSADPSGAVNEKTPELRIFVSSPGDVGQERRIAECVIERLDAEFGEAAELAPYFWEYEPFVITGDYQSQIPPPSEFDIFICILWSRLGSRMDAKYTLPPDHERVARSGTEFEFVDARIAYEERQTPDILVWVNKTQPQVPISAPDRDERIAQWEKLREFLQEWTTDDAEKIFTGAVNRYATREEFEDKLETKLRKIILRRLGLRDEEIRSRASWPGNPYRGLSVFGYRHAPVFFGRTAAVAEVVDKLRSRLQAVWRESRMGIPARRGQSTSDSEPAAAAEDDEPRAFVLIFGASGSGKSSLARAGVLPMLAESGAVEGVGLWRCAVLKPSDGDKNLALSLANALVQPADDETQRPAALPELQSDGTTVASIARQLLERPESAPDLVKGALSEAAAVLRQREIANLQAAIDRDRAAGRETDAEHLEKQLERLQTNAQPRRACLALVLDQLEELFTGDFTADAIRRFLRAVDALAASGRVAVIATLRSEFFVRCEDYGALMGLKQGEGTVHLGPPRPHELAQMIRRPAQAAGVRFEETDDLGRLDERILKAARDDPDSLPLLEFCLEKLYDHGAENGLLEHGEYEEIGKLDGVLSQHAEEVFSGLEDPSADATLRDVMRSLATLGDRQTGGANVQQLPEEGEAETAPLEIVRRVVSYAELTRTAAAKDLVDAFIAARLFTTDLNADGERTVSVTHEALLRKWDRVSAQLGLDENQRFLRVRARVAQRLAQWTESAKSSTTGRPDPGFLLQRGQELGEAEEQFERHANAFNREEREFIQASRAEARRREKLRNRIKLAVIGALSVLSAVALIGVWMAVQKSGELESQIVETEEALETAEVNLTLARIEEGKAWLERARLNESQGNHFAAAMMAGRAIGFEGYGRESAPSEFAQRFPVLLPETEAVDRYYELQPKEPLGTAPASPRENCESLVHRIVAGRCLPIWVTNRIQHHARKVTSASISPNGMELASGSLDATVKIWDISSGELKAIFRGHKAGVLDVAWSPSGNLIASSSSDKSIIIWNRESQSRLIHLLGHEGPVNQVEWNNDGKVVASCSDDGTLKIWEVPSGKLFEPLNDQSDGLIAMDWNPNNNSIYTASKDGWIYVCDPVDLEFKQVLKFEGDIRTIAWRPDGKVLAIGFSDLSPVRLWELETNNLTEISGTNFESGVIEWSDDGRTLATSSGPILGKIYLWDPEKQMCIGVLSGPEFVATDLEWDPNGRWLVGSGANFVRKDADGDLRIWNMKAANPAIALESHERAINCIDWSPFGETVATCSIDETIKIWNSSNGQLITTCFENRPVSCVSWKPDSSILAYGVGGHLASHGAIGLWDVTERKLIEAKRAHDGKINAIRWNPDGNLLATASNDNVVRIWNGENLELAMQLSGHERSVTSLDWRQDGLMLATGSDDDTVKLWDIDSGECVATFREHQDRVTDVEWRPDGSVLASASMDGSILLWRADHSASLQSLESEHEDLVLDLSWSPDGTILASSASKLLGTTSLFSQRHNINLWNPSTGEMLATLQGHENWITSLEWSPDGRLIASVSLDQTVRVWDCGIEELIKSQGWPAFDENEEEATWRFTKVLEDAIEGDDLAIYVYDDFVQFIGDQLNYKVDTFDHLWKAQASGPYNLPRNTIAGCLRYKQSNRTEMFRLLMWARNWPAAIFYFKASHGEAPDVEAKRSDLLQSLIHVAGLDLKSEAPRGPWLLDQIDTLLRPHAELSGDLRLAAGRLAEVCAFELQSPERCDEFWPRVEDILRKLDSPEVLNHAADRLERYEPAEAESDPWIQERIERLRDAAN